ncbi:MAG: LysR family transcriptional regulator [Myxococcales bacterium]|nr:LysR family transcriptional regulator [Myxococcales bacterium]
MTMDLNAVSLFVQVAQLGSFRGASAALGVPVSTVSAKVARLEAHLGLRLLERTTRTVRLTEAGRGYLHEVAPALEALEAARRTLQDRTIVPSGLLRLTATMELGLCTDLLPDVLAAYRDRCPQVEVQVELTDRRVDLIEDGFDLAIRMGRLEDSSLVARRLGSTGPLRVYASPAYLSEHSPPEDPDSLADHACLVRTHRRAPAAWRFGEAGRTWTVDVPPTICVNSYLLLRDLAERGLGLARLPSFLADTAVQRGTLIEVLQDFTLPPAHWHVLFPSAKLLPLRVRAFVDLLAERFDSPATPRNR